MILSCGQARRVLWPEEGPRAVTPDVELAERHLAGCEECRFFLDEMRRLGRLTRDLAPRPQAPREVRDRLFKAIARARTGISPPAQRRPAKWMGLALMVALLAGIAVEWGRRDSRSTDPIAGFADDHIQATRGDGVLSGDSASVARWLASRLSFAIEVPSFPNLQLRGARLCIMDGQRGAVVEYTTGDRPVSYFVVPDWQRVAPLPQPAELHLLSRGGYHVVAWREPGLVHALVGDLPQATLVYLARLCIRQAMALLDPSGEWAKKPSPS